MGSSSTNKMLVDNTNISKSSEQPVQRKRRSSENDPFAKLSETTITTTMKTSEEIEGANISTGSESTLSQLVLSPAIFVSYLVSLYVVDKRERTITVSEDSTRYHEKHTKHTFVTPKGHRRWIKSELVDAFEIRGKIMILLVTLSLLLLVVISWVLKKFYISKYGYEAVQG